MRAILVDDEAPARKRLRRLLESIPGVEIVGEAADGVSALQLVESAAPDTVFLDIEMPELDGFGVAEALASREAGAPAVVFVTAYDEHALRAFEVAAVDYLVKPVSAERLEKALQKLKRPKGSATAAASRELAAASATRLAVKCGTRFVVFDPKRITAVIARDHYAAILVDGRELLADDPLDRVAARLDASLFMRVHRSAIINLEHLKELEREGDRKYVAVLCDAAGTRVPVSREKLDELKERLGLS